MPGTPSGAAAPTSRDYQLTIIGGFTDGFHFYPIIIHDNVATIYPHNNLLQYNKTYYVQIDPGVLNVADASFKGIAGNTGWTFTTKRAAPPPDAGRVVVSADGKGDFNTVQGAIDLVDDVIARPRNESGQFLDQFDPLHHDVRRAAAAYLHRDTRRFRAEARTATLAWTLNP